MIDLRGSVALVTGASRGIGRACALRLAQAGADVVVNYVARRTAAEDVAGRILAMGRRAAAVKADVGEAQDVREMAAYVRETFGRLDVLVSNAATGGFRSLLATTERQFQTAMATNVEALLHLLREFLPLLERGGEPHGGEPRGEAAETGTSPARPDAGGPCGRAKVIALSSHGARYAVPLYGLVAMTKAALESLARQAALEFGPRGVNVNVLVSGLVDTDAIRAFPGREKLLARRRERSLTGSREMDADDVADVALFLASPLADMIQGQTIVVDAGVGATLG